MRTLGQVIMFIILFIPNPIGMVFWLMLMMGVFGGATIEFLTMFDNTEKDK